MGQRLLAANAWVAHRWNLFLGWFMMALATGWTFYQVDKYAVALEIVLAIVAGVTILAVRRWTYPVLAAAVCALVVAVLTDERPWFLGASVAVGVFMVASTKSARTTFAVTSTAVIIPFIAMTEHDPSTEALVGAQVFVVALLVAALAGRSMRHWREETVRADERAQLAEESKEAEVRSQLVQERLRIARELHDALGHHLAVVNMQAGLAATVLRRDPDTAEQAIRAVQTSAKDALGEVQATIRLLRDEGDTTAQEPVAGLGRLPDLLAPLRQAGMTIEVTTKGARGTLPPVVDLTAFRIIQEALTNARKYSDGPKASLTLDFAPDYVGIEVSNPIRPGTATVNLPSGRHGLTGMRERAEALGGVFEAGPHASSAYILRARLPRG